MRTKKLLLNSASSLLLQLTTVICGFILPRLMLRSFGSEVNGAVSSISQFLGYISLLEAGVGGVTRAALYNPLAENDGIKISGIVNATQRFFQKIALIFIAYVVVLAFSFKYISQTELGLLFTASLVAILALSTFAQYYFGITYSILLQADQRNYISSTIQIGTVILNTAISAVLLNLGCSVHVVKLVSAGVYILRPLLLNMIAKKVYHINRTVPPDNEAIKQRWNGFGHHIAFYIHNNVDVFVVTVILGLKWASVYSVYLMIVAGIKNIVISLMGSSEAAFGNMLAKKEQAVLENRFRVVETLSSMVIVIFFSVTGLLLLDFIRIYTSGIEDINYISIPIAVFFTISEALHCIKQNYHSLVLAAGHYKETQKGAFLEAGINLVLSVLLAFLIGLPGILLATIIATLYRTIDYVFYLRKKILYRSPKVFFQRLLVNVCSAACVVAAGLLIPFSTPATYWEWIGKALPVFIIACVIVFIWNILFYRKDVIGIFLQFKQLLTRSQKKAK